MLSRPDEMLKELNPAAGLAAGGVDKYGRMAKRNKNFESVLSGIAVVMKTNKPLLTLIK